MINRLPLTKIENCMMVRVYFSCCLALLLSIAAQPAFLFGQVDESHASNMAEGLKLFKSDVRELLIKRCLNCHGGDDVESGFDLSTRAGILKGGDYEEPGVVPGKPEESFVMRLITHDEEPAMPTEGAKLRKNEIEAVRKWIELGAPYDRPLISSEEAKIPWTERTIDPNAGAHWSFQPLRPVDVPRPSGDWIENEIDWFILQRLNEQKIKPNRRADRRTLIRRASLGVIGLPPTPAEVDAFLNDRQPGAWERVVNRLLASKHYGERWGRHWLDVARFGESEGGEHDYDRPNAYHYRDFVIRALNADMSYRQFVQWQIAGDEFAPNNPEALAATGFLAAGTFPTQLTEREFEQARYDQLDDMASTSVSAFLGLSLNCARCHDHKFDPIPARDYYQLVSAFGKTIKGEIEVSPIVEKPQPQLVDGKLPEEIALHQFEKDELPNRFSGFLKKADRLEADEFWRIADIRTVQSKNGSKYAPHPDGSYQIVGQPTKHETLTLRFTPPTRRVTGIRIEALADSEFPRGGPGLAGNGNFCLTDASLAVQVSGNNENGSRVQPVELSGAWATFQQNQSSLSAQSSIDGDKLRSGWAVDMGGIGKDQAIVLQFAQPVSLAANAEFSLRLRFDHPNGRHMIGRIRLSWSEKEFDPASKNATVTDRSVAMPWPVLQTIKSLAAGQPVEESLRQRAMDWYASTLPEWQKLKSKLERRKRGDGGPAKIKMQVASEGIPKPNHHANGRGYPHFYDTTYFLMRGDPAQKDGAATAGYLQVLMRGKSADFWREPAPQGSRTSYQRRSLVNWMTDVKFGAGNLLARVIVNRVWQQHFGKGLVETPNDFGVQCQRPEHWRLLDYLANRLVADGWKLKPIHKLILTSATYTQGSQFDRQRHQRDPNNRLFWRFEMRRLEAEIIRDSILAVAGSLDPTSFGPSQSNEMSSRRSIYLFLKRSRIPSALHLFDFPEPLVSQGRRMSTTTAPQALHLLNSRFIREASVALTRRMFADEKTTEARVKAIYLTALSRPATDQEVEAAVDFLKSQQASYVQQSKTNSEELAFADFCQVVFCMNEFIYVE